MKKAYLGLMGLSAMLILGGCAGASMDKNMPAETTAAGITEAITMVAEEEPQDSAYNGVPTPSGTDVFADGVQEKATGEDYLAIVENKSVAADMNSLLTFSLKVDTSAYNNVERYISSGNLPPQNAVKAEEMINYFQYETAMEFDDGSPFSVYTEVGVSPMDAKKHLALIRVKSKEIDKEELPVSNLTFLIDTSGSMDSYDKLPLLKSAFKLLTDNLTENDKVSIVTYAGSSEVVLDSVSGADKKAILDAIDTLTAGGSTAGAEGIITAYQLAEKNYKDGGNNRIILATDGDFNVGVSSVGDLEKLVTKKRDSGVYFSILGFGTGNLKDDRMETMAKNANGNYSYINSVAAAKKVLVEEMGSNLFVIANDVKAQIEFNPENVKNYRLIGYENRLLNNEDFEDDKKDAGEIGIGTDVVVLVELEMQGSGSRAGLKYGNQETEAARTDAGEFSNELLEVRIRYKNPGESESKLLLAPVQKSDIKSASSTDFNFAASVAAFAQILTNSDYQGDITIEQVMTLAEDSLGSDPSGYRYGFLQMLHQYQNIVR